MTLMYGSDLAAGGWDALNNVTNQIGAGIFPSYQREKILSEILQPAGGTGQTYRPTAPENQSMIETGAWNLAGWLGSPYEENFAVRAKTDESKQLAETMGASTDRVGESLDWALEQTKKVTTLFDQLKGMWEPREVIKEEPRAGTAEGKDVRNLNDVVQRGADVIKAGSAIFGQVFDQVKGLFSKGFPQSETQPMFAIKHELEPSPKLTIGIGLIAVIVIILILVKK